VWSSGVELRWNGEKNRGTKGGASEIQLLVNQEARAVTGYFQTINLGALAMDSGLRLVAAQLENRERSCHRAIKPRKL
jgi:hypothetical protein